MPTLAAKDVIAKIFSQIMPSLSELHPSVQEEYGLINLLHEHLSREINNCPFRI